MTENSAPAVKTTPRWMKITLVVSLAANLGIAGMIGGAALHGPEPDRTALSSPESITMLARAMPPKFQRALRETWRNRREEAHNDKRETGYLRNRLVNALRAEPYDVDAVRAVFADQNVMLSNLTLASQEAIIEQIDLMTPRDRQTYIRRLLEHKRPTPPIRQ